MDLEKRIESTEIFTFDYGEVNLEKLVLTNDIKLVEKLKAQDNIGVLFEPKAFEKIGIKNDCLIYLVGISQDKKRSEK